MKKQLKICAIFTALAFAFATSPIYAKKEKAEKPAKEKKAKKPKKGKKAKFDMQGYLDALKASDFDTAISMLQGIPDQEKTTAQKIDIAMILHYQGDFTGAAEAMENASRDFDGVIGADPAELFRVHAAEATYCGSLYEYMLCDAFNALNYYKAGDMDSAYSRAVKVGDKQRQYMADPKITGPDGIIAQEVSPATEKPPVTDESKTAINTAFSILGLDATSLVESLDSLKMPQKSDPANDIYRSSAFADYLQIVLARQNSSNVDDYIVNELKTLTNDALDLSKNIPSDKGTIELLALTGQINKKQQTAMVVDLTTIFAPVLGPEVSQRMQELGVGISYNFYHPVYVPTPEEELVTVKKVSLSSGEEKEAVLIEDFDVAVMQDINLKARRTAQRNIAADVGAKTPLFPVQLVTIPTLYAAAPLPKLQDGVITKVAGGLNDADPKADIRQACAFPSKAYRADFTVAPGTYTVTVEYSNGTTETIENVTVQAGKPILVESICK